MSESKQPINQSEVRISQENLRKRIDLQREFVNNDVSSTDEEDFSPDETENIRVSFPKRKTKHNSIDYLLQELVNQQKYFLASQRKVMRLKCEMETEEVKTRYLKLDLNNTQIQGQELKEQLNDCTEKLRVTTIDKWLSHVIVLILIITNIYTIIIGRREGRHL